jgi:hypothetical protein
MVGLTFLLQLNRTPRAPFIHVIRIFFSRILKILPTSIRELVIAPSPAASWTGYDCCFSSLAQCYIVFEITQALSRSGCSTMPFHTPFWLGFGGFLALSFCCI